jgi:hypothetical protein
MVVIITNTSLIYYYSESKIALPQPIVQLIHTLDEFFVDELSELQSELAQKLTNLPLDNIQKNELPQYINEFNSVSSFKNNHELLTVGGTCSSKLKGPTKKKIYKWVDDNGTINLSDKPRTIQSNHPVSVVGVIEPKLISINYLSNGSSQNLKNKINAGVLNAKQFFERVVPKSLVGPVLINFRIFSEKNQYASYQRQVAPNLGPSNGFYTSVKNESVVMMYSELQGVKTSIHEAMHSINRHMVDPKNSS